MSSTTGTRPALQPPGGQASPGPPAGQEQGATLGLVSATGLVMGSIIGVGVFTMPAVLAAAGTSSLAVMAVVAAGAMLLAVLFGQLTRRVPNADGGLYAYARHEFGDFAGYITGWSYWISSWAGNAAIVTSWVFYVDALFSLGHVSGWANWGIALVGLWVPAAINLAGLRHMAWFQNVTVVLKYVPLLFVGVVGWFFVRSANFGPFNASGGSLYSCIGIAASVSLFLFIGVEVAAITAKAGEEPASERGPRLDTRHRRQRNRVPARDGRDDGPARCRPGDRGVVWATVSVRRDGTLVQVDRGGHPTINPFINPEHAKDAFNTRHPANDVANYLEAWSSVLQQNGYTPEEATAAALTVLPDILRYDRSQRAAYPNGRHPGDDAFMARMNFLSHGKAGDSGLKPHDNLLADFPYLEPPVPWSPPGQAAPGSGAR